MADDPNLFGQHFFPVIRGSMAFTAVVFDSRCALVSPGELLKLLMAHQSAPGELNQDPGIDDFYKLSR